MNRINGAYTMEQVKIVHQRRTPLHFLSKSVNNWISIAVVKIFPENWSKNFNSNYYYSCSRFTYQSIFLLKENQLVFL